MATQNKSGQKPVQKLKETSVAAGRFPFRAATIFAPVFEQTCLRSVTGSWSNLKDAPNRSVNIALRCSSAHTGVRSDNQLQQMFNLNRIHVQLEWNPCSTGLEYAFIFIRISTRGGTDQIRHPELFERLGDRHHRTVDAAVDDVIGVVGLDQGLSAKMGLEQLNRPQVQSGEVGQGMFLSFAVLIDVGFPEHVAVVGTVLVSGGGG